MAVFKYLMGIEPEEAVRHPKFPLVVAGFEQQARVAVRWWLCNGPEVEQARWRNGPQEMSEQSVTGTFPVPQLAEPLIEELVADVPQRPAGEIQRYEKNPGIDLRNLG
jgi:hypothetical protein